MGPDSVVLLECRWAVGVVVKWMTSSTELLTCLSTWLQLKQPTSTSRVPRTHQHTCATQRLVSSLLLTEAFCYLVVAGRFTEWHV